MSSFPELLASLDVETDGPIPLRNSMLSIGCAIFTPDKEVVGTFYRNITPLHEACPDPETMTWWYQHPEAYAGTLVDARDAYRAMAEFADWFEDMSKLGPIDYMAYPGLFDGMFLRTYAKAFGSRDTINFDGGWCLKSLIAGNRSVPFRKATSWPLPAQILSGTFPINHNALDDAASQGAMGVNLIRYSRCLPPIRTVTLLCDYRPPAFGTEALTDWVAE